MTWLTIPSAKAKAEAQACVQIWRDRGYKVALWRDREEDAVDCDFQLIGPYPGYARACNALIQELLVREPEAEFFICAGDDIKPDPYFMADKIAFECGRHFGEAQEIYRTEVTFSDWGRIEGRFPWSTFGVMQPTGDRWGEDPKLPNLHPMRTAYIDRVAGSAWYGRAYCERMYGGNGPLFDGYHHMFCDNEARDVAIKMGVYWERLNLCHFHRHWAREKKPIPAYLKMVNGPKHWEESKRLYETRKSLGFPGHEPTSPVTSEFNQGIMASV